MNDDRIELQKIGAYLDERLPGALKDPEFLALVEILQGSTTDDTGIGERFDTLIEHPMGYFVQDLFCRMECYLFEKHFKENGYDFKLFFYALLFISYLQCDKYGFEDKNGSHAPENEFEQFGKNCNSFSEFFEEYSRREHPVPFDWDDDVINRLESKESKTDDLMAFNVRNASADSFLAGFDTTGLPGKTVQAKAPHVIFLDPSYRDSINSVYRIRQQLFHLAYGAALCHDPRVIEACNERRMKGFENNKERYYEHGQLAPTKATYDPDYIREVVNDNFEQQRNILDKKYKTQSGMIDLDLLLKKCLDTPISDDEFAAILNRWAELESYTRSITGIRRPLSYEEDIEYCKLEDYMSDRDELSCRLSLAIMALDIFSKQSIFLTYMYCRFHKTEEALKELLIKILIRRRMIIDDIKIDVFYDENGVKYSSSVNPIDIIRQKTGYDALHDLSADELIKAIVDLAARQETAVYKSVEGIIAELKAEFKILPDEILDDIFIGGRGGLDSLDAIDERKAGKIVLTQIPSESPNYYNDVFEFTYDHLGVDSDTRNRWHHVALSWNDDGWVTKESLKLPSMRNADNVAKSNSDVVPLPIPEQKGTKRFDLPRYECIFDLDDSISLTSISCGKAVYDCFPVHTSVRTVFGHILNCPVEEARNAERLVVYRRNDTQYKLMPEELFEKYRLIVCGRQQALNELMRAYCEIAKLGMTHEELFWLNIFLDMDEFEGLDSELLDGHIARLRSIYGGRGEKRIKREHGDFEKTFDFALMWPFLTEPLMIMVEYVSLMQLPELLEKKKRFVEKCADRGISSSLEAFLVSLMDKVDENLRAKINEYPDIDGIEALLNEHIIARKDRILELYGGVDGHFKAEATDDAEAGSFDAMTAKVRAFLKTGEVLYKAYVEDENAEPLPDYGCIAIEYYKAIEYLANQLLYRPYYHTVLAARNRVDQSDEELRGYCGNSFLSITTKSGKYKEELEYGTVASFLAGVNGYKWDNSGKSWTRDNNSNKYSIIQNFYSVQKHFNLNRIHRFARNMFDTKDSRNDCAHPKDQGKGFATKARVNVYRDVVSRSEAEAADTLVKELIVELGKLFEQNR